VSERGLGAVSSFERWLIPGGIVAFELFMLWQIWKAIRDGVITIRHRAPGDRADRFLADVGF
jgi:hypothetical protein